MRLIHLAAVQSETPLQPMHVVYTSIVEPEDGLVEHHLREDLGTGWSLPWGSAALRGKHERAEPASLPPFSQRTCSKCNANTPAGKSWLSPHSHGSLTLQESLGASRGKSDGPYLSRALAAQTAGARAVCCYLQCHVWARDGKIHGSIATPVLPN